MSANRGQSDPRRPRDPEELGPFGRATRRLLLAIYRSSRWFGRVLRGEMVRRVGGTARARVIFLFGAEFTQVRARQRDELRREAEDRADDDWRGSARPR